MGKIGSLDYPDYTLDVCVEIVEQIAKEFRGRISVQSLADMLRMAPKSGAFFMKVSSIRDYGLIEGRGELRITDLAERITHGYSEEERETAKGEAFLSVELFRRLYERIGDVSVPEDDRFTIFLAELSQASRMQVAKRAPALRRIYANGIRYVPSEQALSPQAPAAEGRKIGSGVEWEPADDEISFSGGGFKLSLPLALDSLGIIRGTIDVLERKLSKPADATSRVRAKDVSSEQSSND